MRRLKLNSRQQNRKNWCSFCRAIITIGLRNRKFIPEFAHWNNCPPHSYKFIQFARVQANSATHACTWFHSHLWCVAVVPWTWTTAPFWKDSFWWNHKRPSLVVASFRCWCMLKSLRRTATAHIIFSPNLHALSLTSPMWLNDASNELSQGLIRKTKT